ncbi:hypothetical protein EV207_11489 [Scopulibacillus darangshiensis]|uniref:WD40 repeat protein n=1 Tax=Scopulibacillus darangshiensis TaxID=442528 RepID=A0A4R2P4I3_9BACL|nr:translocation protein TolB [Scopulibacillus darangshiensis]TCP28964.1 hypothetical protein EV207_11489 [Scopulibacillus darangshiensis]
MKKSLSFLLIILFMAPWTFQTAKADNQNIKAAFIRNGDLWIKINNQEKQVTKAKQVSTPKWSYDGKWLAYSVIDEDDSLGNPEVWIYSLVKKRNYHITGDTDRYEWAPDQNMLAALSQGVLNITDTSKLDNHRFENVTTGVNNFAWLPDGSGFLASSTADALPDGWTNPILYIVPLDTKMDQKKVKRLFTIPSKLEKGPIDILSIGTTTFKWSADKKWIAFVVSPTASWSADSDMLCVLSSDGKTFDVIDEMLANSNWFKWAPNKNLLGYIEGSGRIALMNKQLNIKELPALQTAFTPHGYADRAFTWINDKNIVVSRVQESEWSNDEKKRPLPVLFHVNIQNQEQTKLTTPPASWGDFSPKYIGNADLLSWIRSDREKANVMLGRPGSGQGNVWIKNIDIGSDFYEQWYWQTVIAIYHGQS